MGSGYETAQQRVLHALRAYGAAESGSVERGPAWEEYTLAVESRSVLDRM